MADRDVKVALKIEAAGEQASRQMKDLATQAKDALAQVKALNAEQAKLKQSPTAAAVQQRQQLTAPPVAAYQPPSVAPPAAYQQPAYATARPVEPPRGPSLLQTVATGAQLASTATIAQRLATPAVTPPTPVAAVQPEAKATPGVDAANKGLANLAMQADKTAAALRTVSTEATAPRGRPGTGAIAPAAPGAPRPYPPAPPAPARPGLPAPGVPPLAPSGDPFAQVRELEKQRLAQQAAKQGLPPSPAPGAPPRSPYSDRQLDQFGRQLRDWERPERTPRGAAPEAKPQTGLLSPQNQELLALSGGIVAAVKVLATGLAGAAKAIDTFSDETLSVNQKIRKTGEALDPTGLYKAVNELSDAISGRSEAIRRVAREVPLAIAQSQANVSTYQQSAPVTQQIEQLEARARATAAAPIIPFRPPARDGSVQGDEAFSEYERRFGVEQEKRRADIERDATAQQRQNATREREARQRELDEALKARQQLEVQQAAAAAQPNVTRPRLRSQLQVDRDNLNRPGQFLYDAAVGLGQPVFGPGDLRSRGLDKGSVESSTEDKRRLEVAAEIAKSIEKEKELRQKLATATQQEAVSIQNALQAESKARQANIGLQKQELEFLKEKEARIKQTSASFGSLSAIDKQAALESAEALKNKGYDALTPEAKQALQGAGFGNVLQAEAIKSAQADDTFKKISQLLGQEFDLKAAQAAQVDLQAEIQLSLQIDEQTLAQQLKDALTPVLEDLKKSFKELAQAQVNSVKIGQEIQAASQ